MLTTAAPSLPRAEQRRRAILAATLRVIAEGGVDAVTHRRVAAKAGVSLSSTTYHFDTRDDLIVEAFEHYIVEANEMIGSVSIGSVRSLEDAIDFAMDYARREFADPQLLQAEYELILYAARAPRVRKAFLTWQRGIESMMAEILERLTRPETDLEELRWRLELVAGALHADSAPVPAAHKTKN